MQKSQKNPSLRGPECCQVPQVGSCRPCREYGRARVRLATCVHQVRHDQAEEKEEEEELGSTKSGY